MVDVASVVVDEAEGGVDLVDSRDLEVVVSKTSKEPKQPLIN